MDLNRVKMDMMWRLGVAKETMGYKLYYVYGMAL